MYCGLTDARMKASEKDLPVEIYFQLFKKTREFSNSFVLIQFDELK